MSSLRKNLHFDPKSDHGYSEIPVNRLTKGPRWNAEASKTVSDEYAKLVQEHPEYEFAIVTTQDNSAIRVSWKRRTTD